MSASFIPPPPSLAIINPRTRTLCILQHFSLYAFGTFKNRLIFFIKKNYQAPNQFLFHIFYISRLDPGHLRLPQKILRLFVSSTGLFSFLTRAATYFIQFCFVVGTKQFNVYLYFQQQSYSIITYVRLYVHPSVCQVQAET